MPRYRVETHITKRWEGLAEDPNEAMAVAQVVESEVIYVNQYAIKLEDNGEDLRIDASEADASSEEENAGGDVGLGEGGRTA